MASVLAAGLLVGWTAVCHAEVQDIIVLFVDHWEPRIDGDGEQVTSWLESYRAFADRHHDSDGRPLRHTWFQRNWSLTDSWGIPSDPLLRPLLDICYEGYGEIDLHVHHHEPQAPPANESSFVTGMGRLLADFHRHGIAVTAEAQPRCAFAFIHGMWALDNSRLVPAAVCGINHELILLRELGCYADFTFPSGQVMDPTTKNVIFWAADDDSPKSYDVPGNARPAAVGEGAWGDLLIFPGPEPPYPTAEPANRLTPANFARWLQAGIHVAGRPEWTFVKLHTHGLQQAAVGEPNQTSAGTWGLWGEGAQEFWSHLERDYDDGVRYRLHYVSAREAYNLVRAAQDGLAGNPYDHRDHVIPPYVHLVANVDAPYHVVSWSSDLVIALEELPAVATIRTRYPASGFVVEESVDGTAWASTDGRVDATGSEIVVRDPTPSFHYRFRTALGRLPLRRLPEGSERAERDRVDVAFTFDSASARELTIEIFDVRARRVQVLRTRCEAGTVVLPWNGRNSNGERVPSGVYLGRIRGEPAAISRVVVLR